jgi:hypothetical protein
VPSQGHLEPDPAALPLKFSLSGAYFFGFGQPSVQSFLERLDHVDLCTSYVLQFHHASRKIVSRGAGPRGAGGCTDSTLTVNAGPSTNLALLPPLPENRMGCARAAPISALVPEYFKTRCFSSNFIILLFFLSYYNYQNFVFV